MNTKTIAFGLSLLVVSSVSLAGDPVYYGPHSYSNSYGSWYGHGHKSVSHYKTEYDGPYWDSQRGHQYWVKRSVPVYVESQPSQGWVPNPGRYYVEKYAPHAAGHVPPYVPAEKVKTPAYTYKNGVYYENGPAPVTKSEVKKTEPQVIEESKPFVPEPGKKYYIEDGVYKEVIPGSVSKSSSEVGVMSEEEARGRAIGEYYRRRYGR